MVIRKLLIALACFSFGSASAVNVVMVSADGSKDQAQLSEIQDVDIVKDADPTMRVNFKDGSTAEGLKTLILGDTIATEQTESQAVAGVEAITIYPNPVSHYLTVTGINDDVRTKVIDTQGRLVRSSFGPIVDVQGLPAGIYTLCVKGKFIRFIKE